MRDRWIAIFAKLAARKVPKLKSPVAVSLTSLPTITSEDCLLHSQTAFNALLDQRNEHPRTWPVPSGFEPTCLSHQRGVQPRWRTRMEVYVLTRPSTF